MTNPTPDSRQSVELSTILALSNSRATRPIKAGDVIYNDGDPGDILFGVVSGSVELRWDGGRREVVGPGSCFGVAALVDEDHRRFGSARALSDGELLEMDRHEFLFALQELPMFALEMLHDLEVRLQQLKMSEAG